MILTQRLGLGKQRALNLSGVLQILAQWKRNSRTRKALLELEEYQLKDIGIDPRMATKEGRRMFWQ